MNESVNAPQDDLTAERADLKEIARKLVLQINEITPVQWDKHDDKDQAIILAALKTARQEALIDVMRLHKEWRAGKHSGLFSDLLDRLASEGAPAPIDLLPKLKDDGGYGEHF